LEKDNGGNISSLPSTPSLILCFVVQLALFLCVDRVIANVRGKATKWQKFNTIT